MPAAAQIPVTEYLATTFRPDREFVDGELVERHVGERSHSQAQSRILNLLTAQAQKWNIEAFVELRVQVTSDRFRVPDVCALLSSAPYEEVVHHPPLLCVEILSKDDVMTDMLERVEDYLKMGVPCIWIVDPRTRKGYQRTLIGLQEATDGVLRVPSSQIAVPLADIFE